MATIAYVVTKRDKLTPLGDAIYVYYTNGRDRRYTKETVPQTALDFCVTARRCVTEDEPDGLYKTYMR